MFILFFLFLRVIYEYNVDGYEKKEFGKEGSEENERHDSRSIHIWSSPRHVQLDHYIILASF